MKLQIRTTFDFGKLASQMPKILEKHTQRTARSSAAGAREAIDKGVSPPLKKSTIEIRKKRGTSFTTASSADFSTHSCGFAIISSILPSSVISND